MYADTDGEGARGGLSNGWQWVVVDPARERSAVDAGSPGGMGVRKRQGQFRVRRFVGLTWGAVAAAARGRVGVQVKKRFWLRMGVTHRVRSRAAS